MKHSFKLQDGSTITVTALHAARHVMIEKIFPLGSSNDPRSFFIPPELAGVIAQAIELTGQTVIDGVCRDQHAPLGRGMADAKNCAAGMSTLAF